jgi:C-methyltransferase C-terminal domain/Putative zinc binding domain/Methyltransferase domain
MFVPSMDCRSCLAPLDGILDLGEHPIAGDFAPPGSDPRAPLRPLRLAICPRCGLVQLADDTPDEVDHPDTVPPTSSGTMSAHVGAMVDELVSEGRVRAGSRTLSLASHGGHLWPFLRERGIDAVVFERSAMWAHRLRAQGADVVEASSAGAVLGQPSDGRGYDLVVDHYLLAHLREPDAAVAAIATLLEPDGSLVLEFDHLLATVQGLQFDAIRHGHHTYLALGWVVDALARHGLTVVRAVEQPVYGGALRVRAVRGSGRPDASVQDVLAREAAARIDRAEGFRGLVEGVARIRRETLRYLEESRKADRRVLGYGAPARAVTFLNTLGVHADLLPFTADRSPAKQGCVVPGVGIPIRSPDDLERAEPDDVLVLAWDLAAEIRRERRAIEDRGGRFVVAIPELSVVSEHGHRPLAATLTPR